MLNVAEDDSDSNNPSLAQSKMAEGGAVDEYEDADKEEPASIAEAIMQKRKKYADGGQVDLSRNADEDRNEEDQMSFNALKKENYSESDGLNAIDRASKMDSGQHGDDIEKDVHDMVSKIHQKMRAKRGHISR
jgi:hypothetical protein